MSAPDTARAYISRGWTVVPIPAGRKGPAEEGWQHLRISLDGVAQHFSAGCNIGGLPGPASGELFDVDLDCPEALALADQYLPPTQAIFGRRARPQSHQLYIAPGAAFETFADPLGAGKNMPLELCAAGRHGGAHQTLLPPSVADRERREWHGEIIAPAVINSHTVPGASELMDLKTSRFPDGVGIHYDYCWAKDTKIKLLSGEARTIEELSKLFRDKQLYTYSHTLDKKSAQLTFGTTRRLRDRSIGCFCRKSPHMLGLRVVCDAVRLGTR